MSKATLIKHLIFRFGIGLLTFLLGIGLFIGWEYIKGSPSSNELTLGLVSDTPVLRVNEYPTIKLYITNNGNETVTLVHPGDGSEAGWRTPVLRWSIIRHGDWSNHPTFPDLQPQFRSCGNINSLDWDEVFRLAPGEIKGIEAGLPPFTEPGRYRVKFFYANRPSMEWGGYEMGIHHPIAMWRVKHSTETTLSSNEILFTVNE